jgi:hypothetical protein
MSVAITINDLDLPHGWQERKCVLCDGKLWPPFLHWHNQTLFICGECCRQNKNGLTADLVHVAAIMDLRNLGYLDQTLQRRGVKTIEKQIEKEIEIDRTYRPIKVVE